MASSAEISATELHDTAQRIKELRKAATEHAVEIGRELLSIKEKMPHGAFVKWVEKACEFKIRTAQDLMKLAREAHSDEKLVALMVPSTLRVYLSKKIPPAVRSTILKRLENGERISRNEIYSQASDARTTAKADAGDRSIREGMSSSFFSKPETLKTTEEKRSNAGGDRARAVAELILRRLSPQDYETIMEETSWEVWNRAFVWMRAAQIVDSERVELTLSNAPAPQNFEALPAKLQ
ncbi:DUF3102 domain-containing protein [Bosea sp. TAF32]|uniref:DUF3102 domain-containing protein n=1 Tax=Bosea sp. TAF32 TaxID=3237482 RepID=UPI003F8ECFA6